MIRLKITEIFHSIQGESTLTGERFSFIRLTGCPLRCTYCDTTYSYTGGKWMFINEIIEQITPHQTEHVLITGGEPLAQKNCIHLVHALKKLNKKISIETDGEEDLTQYISLAKIIMDIKTPGSGEKAEKCFENLKLLQSTDEVKFIVCDYADYVWAKNIYQEYKLAERCTVLISPVFGQLNLKQVANWILEDKLNVRLQTQLHKHIWGENQKGV